MAINTQKVLVGGLVAGVVVNVFDWVTYGLLLGDRMKAESNAFKPGLGDQMAQMDGATTAKYVIIDLIIGLLLVWAYAVARPRFGPGPKTAVYVAIAYWIFAALMNYGYLMMGIMSFGLWISFAIIWLVCLVVATTVGAMLYKEEVAV
jgi:hypothetical protein